MTELVRGEAKKQAVRSMFDRIAGRYDMLNRILTFGMDRGWRRRAVASLGLAPGCLVADLACGTADLCRELVASGMRAVGVDFSRQMLAHAGTGVGLVQADVLELPLKDAGVDGATCGFALRNVTGLDEMLAEMARVVRPGGRIALLEVGQPSGRAARAVHRVYFHHVVPLIGGLLSDRKAYRYLPRSTAYLPPVGVLLDALARAGFDDVSRQALGLGAAQLFTGTRR